MKRIHTIFGFAILLMAMLQSCSTTEYDENLRIAFGTMEVIYKDSDKVSQSMKKLFGSYLGNFDEYDEYDDGQDALAERAYKQYDAFEKEGVIQRIADNINLLHSQSASLKNPPLLRRDCHNDFIRLASQICQYGEETSRRLSMRTDSSLDVLLFIDDSSTESINSMMNDFKLKYADILYAKEN